MAAKYAGSFYLNSINALFPHKKRPVSLSDLFYDYLYFRRYEKNYISFKENKV